MVEADHLAASVSLGVHGRRRAGMGESFWQFRRYTSTMRRLPSTGANRPSRSICLCASANGKRPRPSGSGAMAAANMDFSAPAAMSPSSARADLLLLALASLLVRGGERVGFMGGRRRRRPRAWR